MKNTTPPKHRSTSCPDFTSNKSHRALCGALPALLAGAWMLFSLPAVAQSVSTLPAGQITFTIPARVGSAPYGSLSFSLPLRESVPDTFVGKSRGVITSVTATTIANIDAGWAPGALSQSGSPYFLRILTGAAEGRTLQISTDTANTDTTASVLNQGTDLTSLGIVSGTDTYEIFPGDTLFSLFGTSTLGGTSTSNADYIQMNDGSGWFDYYYNTSASCWRKSGQTVNQNDFVIRPDAGMLFYRRALTPLTITILGSVPDTNLRYITKGVSTFVGSGFPVDQTLGTANYNALAGWINYTGSESTSDRVKLWGPNWLIYTYDAVSSQWRKGTSTTNQNNVALPAGTPVIISRPSTATALTTLVRTLPYSLND